MIQVKCSLRVVLMMILLIGYRSDSFAQLIEGTSNTISIQVGKTKEVLVKPDEESLAAFGLSIDKLPKYHALIIGISEYQNAGVGLTNLENPVPDAERLYRLLINKYAFDSSLVTLLRNPSEDDILSAFGHLSEVVTEKESVLIFYAGHGIYDKSKDFGYWLPADSKPGSRGAWISNTTIKDYIGAIKSKHTLLISDACFGGSILKSRSVSNTIMRFSEANRNKSRKAMTSGNLSEVPDNSVFLKFFLKSLEENTDVFLTAASLWYRIYEPILNNTTTSPQFGVVQGAGDEGGDFTFIKKD
jgi:Caspase domain